MITELKSILLKALDSLEGTDQNLLEVVPATHPRFGDFQTNVALQHAKILRKSPLVIAEELVSHLSCDELLESVEVQKPGFINLRLSKSFLESRLSTLYNSENLDLPSLKAPRTMVLDYSSPNVAKTMHVAHLRSTIQGESLKRIYRALGWKVIADNHIGDWGTQFGKLLFAYKNFEHPGHHAQDSIAMLEEIYQEFVRKAEGEPELEERAREELASLQRKEEPNYSLWKKFLKISLGEFHGLYERLGIEFDTELGESFYHDKLSPTVESIRKMGLSRKSEGAEVIFFEDDQFPPFLIQKKDGSFLYSTTDIAAILYREETYSPDRIVYVTDNRQKLHFQQLFKVADSMGLGVELIHAPFGLMKFEQGVVMSTRKGAVIRLEELLDEAQNRAYGVIKDSPYSQVEKQEIARIVGLGAVKYQDLCQNPASDILFSWEKALNLEGNSAPYLQYAYARVCGISRKYSSQFEIPQGKTSFKLRDSAERDLALFFFLYPHAVSQAASQYKPHIDAEYLFNLAQKFASFYAQCSVLKEQDSAVRESRFHLCSLSARILAHGLNLLGIEIMERM